MSRGTGDAGSSPNIGWVLTKAADRFGDQVAIRYGSTEYSYAQWDARVDALAHGLAGLGVGRGDRVAVLQQNGPALLETLFATFKLGAIAVPINAKLHHEEYGFIIGHAEASAAVFTPDFVEGIDAQRARLDGVSWVCTVTDGPDWATPLPELLAAEAGRTSEPVGVDEDDVCWLFYTSGTTGRPKGAMVTHGNLGFMCRQYPLEVRQVEPGEVVLHSAPLTHAGGLWSLPLTAAGATHVIPEPPAFDPVATLHLIERERVRQIAFLAPTMLTMLLDAAETVEADTSSLELIGYGGSPAYSSELRRATARFGNVLCQIYGQGECPMTISMLSPAQHQHPDPAIEARRLTSAGTVREGIEVVVLDDAGNVLPPGTEGEICVRGPVVMKGYWKDPAATDDAFAHGWYHSGDLGRIDDDGYVYLLDRIKDLIITGGSNVYGREVEDVLLMHPAVREAAVIGLPDPKWGELVTALLVVDGEPPTVDELSALVSNHLANFKKPRRWEFVTELPKNGYGKVLKRELRARLAVQQPDATS